jgi:hypothetical protein
MNGSSFDDFLSNLEYSAAAGLSAGVNSAFGNPTLAQVQPVAAASSGISTQTIILLAAAAVVLILVLR